MRAKTGHFRHFLDFPNNLIVSLTKSWLNKRLFSLKWSYDVFPQDVSIMRGQNAVFLFFVILLKNSSRLLPMASARQSLLALVLPYLTFKKVNATILQNNFTVSATTPRKYRKFP